MKKLVMLITPKGAELCVCDITEAKRWCWKHEQWKWRFLNPDEKARYDE